MEYAAWSLWDRIYSAYRNMIALYRKSTYVLQYTIDAVEVRHMLYLYLFHSRGSSHIHQYSFVDKPISTSLLTLAVY